MAGAGLSNGSFSSRIAISVSSLLQTTFAVLASLSPATTTGCACSPLSVLPQQAVRFVTTCRESIMNPPPRLTGFTLPFSWTVPKTTTLDWSILSVADCPNTQDAATISNAAVGQG